MTIMEESRNEVEVYRSGAAVPFVAGIVLSAAEARGQVEAIRELQQAVMAEGRDYGMVPGIERPTLFKSGAELLLKVHGYGHHLDPVEVERDEHGRKFGLTYRCTVTLGPRDREVVVATCDGYCGYDESKYYQSVTTLEARERANATKYQRPARPDKWAEEYRAPWNTLLKMAEKRALVGAALQATAASGLFTQDLEDGADTAVAPPPLPVWEQLGYTDDTDLRAANDPLLEMMKQVPADSQTEVGEAFDRLGYAKGRRFPVSREHAEALRVVLLAATSGADAGTGEIPPDGPGAAETGAQPPEQAESGQSEPKPYRSALDGIYADTDELGNPRPDYVALRAAVAEMHDRDLAHEADARGLDSFEKIDVLRDQIVNAVIAANPAVAATSTPPGRPEPDHAAALGTETDQPTLDQPDNLSPAKDSESVAKKKRSAGSEVHANLATLGVKAKEDQEAIIRAASMGRTVHAAELSKTEAAVAYGLAKSVQAGDSTMDDIRAAAADA